MTEEALIAEIAELKCISALDKIQLESELQSYEIFRNIACLTGLRERDVEMQTQIIELASINLI